jgi:hypothetical protein
VKKSPGDAVIRQGEQGDVLFIVESGELDCTKIFVSIIIKMSDI